MRLLSLVVAFVLLFNDNHAKAAPVITSGPSVPLLRLSLEDKASGKFGTSVLSAGAGYQVNFGFNQIEFNGNQYDLVDLALAGFVGAHPEGTSSEQYLSAAGLVCTLSSLVCAGFGVDMLDLYAGSTSGVLAANVGKANLFGLLSLSIAFDFGLPTSTPAVLSDGPGALPRGNTVHF